MCPNCKTLMRLNELNIRYNGKTQKTWLDKYQSQVDIVEEIKNDFDEKESEYRSKGTERGRKKVPKIIEKSMEPNIAALKLDPFDIQPVLHPIDFVVYNGMNKEKMKDVILLSNKSTNQQIVQIQKSITKAVKTNSYEWKVARVSLDGQITYER